jgi:hypothetical protein
MQTGVETTNAFYRELETAKRDFGIRRAGPGVWFVRAEDGSWYSLNRREVKRFLVVRFGFSRRRFSAGNLSEVDLVMEYITDYWRVDYVGREAERMALQYRHELGATPSEPYLLKSGEYELRSGEKSSYYPRHPPPYLRGIN